MNKIYRTLCTLFLAGLCCLMSSLYADNKYLLCGSDEDGCHDFSSCACIPYNEIEEHQPYCLDLDSLNCKPLSQTPDCYPLFIHKNQAECLATLFQSEPHPACKVVSAAFCLENHVWLCDKDGQLNSCKPGLMTSNKTS